eukprot:scaffold137882_cov72-Phaeocystis_antarctica.AAC.2
MATDAASEETAVVIVPLDAHAALETMHHVRRLTPAARLAPCLLRLRISCICRRLQLRALEAGAQIELDEEEYGDGGHYEVEGED